MKNCLRCNEEMIENLEYKVDGALYGLKISKKGLFGNRLGYLNIVVCPKCGYVENYIENIDIFNKKIKK